MERQTEPISQMFIQGGIQASDSFSDRLWGHGDMEGSPWGKMLANGLGLVVCCTVTVCCALAGAG